MSAAKSKLTPEQQMKERFKIYEEYENLTWEEACERYDKNITEEELIYYMY